MSLQMMVQLGVVTNTHAYTLLRTNDYTLTHTRHTVGVNQGFQLVIEQRRHLQASVRSNICAERCSSWSRLNMLRWIIKALGDLSRCVKLRTLCDHGVVMSCILGRAACQLLCYIKRLLFFIVTGFSVLSDLQVVADLKHRSTSGRISQKTTRHSGPR